MQYGILKLKERRMGMKEETKKDIRAIIIWVFIAAVIAFLFVPMSRDLYIESPAIMIDTKTKEITETTLVFDGEWVWKNIWPFGKEYKGKIIINSLEYTDKDNGFLSDIRFIKQRFTGEREIIKYASYFYNSQGSIDGHATVFTDTDMKMFYIHTSPSSPDYLENDEYYIIIAPAKNKEEAKEVCEKLGIEYPEN